MKELEEMADAVGMDCLLMPEDEDDLVECWNGSRAKLLALANAIAAKEREACAQECERAYSVSAVSYETGAACARFNRARSKA